MEGSLVTEAWTLLLLLQWNPEGLLLITLHHPTAKGRKENTVWVTAAPWRPLAAEKEGSGRKTRVLADHCGTA